MPWYFCSDKNHRILGTRLTTELAVAGSPFEPRHITTEDMGAVPRRAAGGAPVMDFKLETILNTCLRDARDGEHFVWSDVDVQPTAPLERLRAALSAAAAEDVDVWTQREFRDAGANVGFMLLRGGAATRRLLAAVRTEMARTGGLDQKVLNGMVLAGETCGARVRRLPATVWASSNAEGAAPLGRLLLHHANFTLRDKNPAEQYRYAATNPQPKLDQLDRVRDIVDGADEAGWRALTAEIAEDRDLAIYKARNFDAETIAAWQRIERQ